MKADGVSSSVIHRFPAGVDAHTQLRCKEYILYTRRIHEKIITDNAHALCNNSRAVTDCYLQFWTPPQPPPHTQSLSAWCHALRMETTASLGEDAELFFTGLEPRSMLLNQEENQKWSQRYSKRIQRAQETHFKETVKSVSYSYVRDKVGPLAHLCPGVPLSHNMATTQVGLLYLL